MCLHLKIPENDSGLYIYHLLVWKIFFLYSCKWITFPLEFAALAYHVVNFLNLYHHLTYTCYYVVSYLFCYSITGPYPLFYAAIWKDSVSLINFPFCSHAQVFQSDISSVCRLKYPYSCFSSHFCFLVIVILLIFMLPLLFLVTVIFPYSYEVFELSY